MAKDPAFLFYPGDWQGGTMLLSRHQKGCYMDLLIAQFHAGPLSLEEVKAVLGSDFGQVWPTLSKKFKTNQTGLFFNERMATEIEKRKKFSETRRKSLDIKNGDLVNIYLLFNPDKNLYKIGSSKYPGLRLQEAKKKNPAIISFWISEDVIEREIEQKLQDMFFSQRKYFDWFSLSSSDITKLINYCEENYKNKSRTELRTENENVIINENVIKDRGSGEGNGPPGADKILYPIEDCLVFALKDPRWVKANKTNENEVKDFIAKLEKRGIYEKNPAQFKEHFANWKMKGKTDESLTNGSIREFGNNEKLNSLYGHK